jgi:xanthine dehydrogenase YagS FAD-binding subunit
MSAAPIISSSGDAAEFRAAGTDLSERRRSGVSRGPLIDIAPTPEMTTVDWDSNGAAHIGASLTIDGIANDPAIAAAYPGLAAAADGLATPQIRRLATIGGNLAQRSRCWYYRNPHIACLKKGGSTCPARAGNHLYGVVFDFGPCIAPHPSTMAAALLAYDAKIVTDRRARLTIAQLLGDGSDGARDNALEPGEVIQRIELPPPIAGERALYKRAISRAYAEWPLVEIVARAEVAAGSIRFLRLAAGGVAPVPVRLTAAETAAQGASANRATIAEAAKQSVIGAKALQMTRYKLALLEGLVQDLLERLFA